MYVEEILESRFSRLSGIAELVAVGLLIVRQPISFFEIQSRSLSVSLCLCLCLSVCLSLSLSFSQCLSVCLSVCLSTRGDVSCSWFLVFSCLVNVVIIVTSIVSLSFAFFSQTSHNIVTMWVSKHYVVLVTIVTNIPYSPRSPPLHPL